MVQVRLLYDEENSYHHVLDNKGNIICNTLLWKQNYGKRTRVPMTELTDYDLCYHCEDSCFLTMCQEVVDREDVIALLKGVLYPGIWSYECPTCSPRMEPVADLE